jgi:hypothetical protein
MHKRGIVTSYRLPSTVRTKGAKDAWEGSFTFETQRVLTVGQRKTDTALVCIWKVLLDLYTSPQHMNTFTTVKLDRNKVKNSPVLLLWFKPTLS